MDDFASYDDLIDLNIPSPCQACDLNYGETLLECKRNTSYSIYCIVIGSIILILNLIVGCYIGYALYNNFRRKSWITFKATIQMSGVFFCAVKVLRCAIVLGKLQYQGIGFRVFDSLLEWYSEWSIFYGYSTMLVFWIGLCSRMKVTVSCFKSPGITKWSHRIANVLIFIIAGIAGVTQVYFNSLNIIYITVVGFVCVVLALSFMIKGFQVYRFVRSIQFGPQENNTSRGRSATISRITTLVFGSSTIFFVELILLLIFFVVLPESLITQILVDLLGELGELFVTAVISIPLGSPSSSGRSSENTPTSPSFGTSFKRNASVVSLADLDQSSASKHMDSISLYSGTSDDFHKSENVF